MGGDVRVNPHLRIGRYNQHSEDVLDLNMNPLDFMDSMYPDGIVTTGGKKKMDITDWRGQLGQYGISGKRRRCPCSPCRPASARASSSASCRCATRSCCCSTSRPTRSTWT